MLHSAPCTIVHCTVYTVHCSSQLCPVCHMLYSTCSSQLCTMCHVLQFSTMPIVPGTFALNNAQCFMLLQFSIMPSVSCYYTVVLNNAQCAMLLVLQFSIMPSVPFTILQFSIMHSVSCTIILIHAQCVMYYSIVLNHAQCVMYNSSQSCPVCHVLYLSIMPTMP